MASGGTQDPGTVSPNTDLPVQPVNNIYIFFPSMRAGGILQILQPDWFREQAVFYDLAR